MDSNPSVMEMLARLEEQIAHNAEREAFHAGHEAFHCDQRSSYADELERLTRGQFVAVEQAERLARQLKC